MQTNFPVSRHTKVTDAGAHVFFESSADMRRSVREPFASPAIRY
jgi:hypothetical protein